MKIILCSFLLCLWSFAFAGPDAKNILFISADDLNCDIACYGVPQVKTPHLDRLAKMGVRFDRAYCQQPLCGPSRASVMTGLRPDTTGFHKLHDDLRTLRPNAVTLGQFFRNQAIVSARVGKIYHYNNPSSIGTDGKDDIRTWDVRYNPAGIDKRQEENIIRYPGGVKGIKDRLGISMAWWDPVSEDDDHTDGMVTSRAIKLMDEYKDQRWFIAAGFFNPHCPYVAPKKYFDMYPLEEIEMQDWESAKKDLEDVPPMAVMRDTRNWPYYFKDITLEEARRCKQAYYACVSFTDAQVGRLLDALDDRGLTDETLIVFWSDHGYFLGEKGLWYKRKNFERVARVPLLIAGAGIKPQPAGCATPVELIDLYPTVLDYAGFTPTPDLDGQSLRPLLEDPTNKNAGWNNKPAITQVIHNPKSYGYSIRVPGWRYIEWKHGEAGRELYDQTNDPQEITNLAKDPKHAALIKKLSAQLAPFSTHFK